MVVNNVTKQLFIYFFNLFFYNKWVLFDPIMASVWTFWSLSNDMYVLSWFLP